MTEHLTVDAHSPRLSHNAFIVEASPSRHRSHSRRPDIEYEEVIERPRVRGISRPRSVSVHGRRRLSSPVQLIEPRRHEERLESDRLHTGPLAIVARPRHSDNDVSNYIRDLEEETRLLRLERQGGIEITQRREMDTIDNRGNEEEVTEIRQQERKGML